jgi:hypothetical protein
VSRAEWGLLVPSASQTTTRVTLTVAAGKAFRGEPITNELLLEARRDMDLTAAFEELLKRRQARRISISPQSILSQRIHPRAAGGYQGALEGLTATMVNQGRVALLLPSIPICNWIVPTLHILLGIINDIVSLRCLHGRASRGDTEEVQKLQLAQDEKHYASQLAQRRRRS